MSFNSKSIAWGTSCCSSTIIDGSKSHFIPLVNVPKLVVVFAHTYFVSRFAQSLGYGALKQFKAMGDG